MYTQVSADFKEIRCRILLPVISKRRIVSYIEFTSGETYDLNQV